VKLLCVENTHNIGGGSIWPLQQMEAAAATARKHGLAVHLDGARLWHASAKTGMPEAQYSAGFDTVSVCFSKALGAPVGSCLAGPKTFIARARRFKQQFGGGFRQAGIIAAGALYALEHHRSRLGEIRTRAADFARRIAAYPEIDIDPATVETLFASGCEAFPPGNLSRRRTAWEFTCCRPDPMLYERCFISTLQTRMSNMLASWSAKHCGIWNTNQKKAV
jgi:threonine aldolase